MYFKKATKESSDRNDNHSQIKLLVNKVREGTDFIVIDADELFSSDCLTDSWLRKKILSLKKGQALYGPMVNAWASPSLYRINPGYNNPFTSRWAQKPFAFCDDGECNYTDNKSWSTSGAIHVERIPCNRRTQGNCPKDITIIDINKCLIHLKCVNLKNIEIKMVWYMCLEYIKYHEDFICHNHKRCAKKINERYFKYEFWGMLPEQSHDISVVPSPSSWYNYPFFDPVAYQQDLIHQKIDITNWFESYGPSYFKYLKNRDKKYAQETARKFHQSHSLSQKKLVQLHTVL